MTVQRHIPIRATAAAVVMSVARLTAPWPALGPWAPPALSPRPWRRLADRAGRLAAALPWPHALLAAVTLLSIQVVGYRYGTYDQTLLIPFFKHSVDPTLYAADPFLALAGAHVSYFWDLFKPVYRLGMMEPAVFAAFVLFTYLFFWSVWSLAEELFHNRLAAALGVIGLMLPHFGLVGFTQMMMSLLTWTAVLPFTLWALTLYLRRRTVAAFALLGVLYNFHCLSVNFALGLLVLASLADLRRVGARRLLAGLAAFAVLAAPVLLWRAGGEPLDLSLRPGWLDLLLRTGNATLYQVWGAYPLVWVNTTSFAGMVAMFFIARRLAPPAAHDRATLWFMLGILLVVAVEWVVTTWLPVTLLVELQLGRIGVYGLILGYLYFAYYLATAYQAGRLTRAELTALGLALALAPLGTLVLGLWAGLGALKRWRPAAGWQPALIGGLALGLFGVSLGAAARLGLWDPRVQITARQDDWYAAQMWARDHTDKQAVFITPLPLFNSFTPGWRVYSERAVVVTLYDYIDIGYTPSYQATWQARFEALAPGALARFNDDSAENAAITDAAFYGLSDARLLGVARQYGASYLVVARPHLRPWPVAYANGGYVIYDLRGVGQTAAGESAQRAGE